MNAITKKLDQLEAKLQALIEGHIARLLPAQLSKDTLVKHMVAAMQAGARQQEDGAWLAPDIFNIQIYAPQIASFPQTDSFLEDLSEMIYQAGEQAGFDFLRYPSVNLVPNPDFMAGDIDIVAQASQDFPSETLAHEIDSQANSDNIPANAFLIVNGNQVFNLEKTIINIGRRANNDLVIDDPLVSRQHAQLKAAHGRYAISDLSSTGGTFVNDHRVTQATLHPRDIISLAGIPLVYAQDDAIAPEATQKYVHPDAADDDQTTKGEFL
jgi:hypothetical protein